MTTTSEVDLDKNIFGWNFNILIFPQSEQNISFYFFSMYQQ